MEKVPDYKLAAVKKPEMLEALVNEFLKDGMSSTDRLSAALIATARQSSNTTNLGIERASTAVQTAPGEKLNQPDNAPLPYSFPLAGSIP
jgi:hypothetical protein